VVTVKPVIIEASLSWHLEAICADSATYDPDLWFSDSDEARRICAHCPVRNECLSYAMDVEQESGAQLIGVWGGLSPIQRKRLRQYPDRLDRMRRVRSRTKVRLAAVIHLTAPQPQQMMLALGEFSASESRKSAAL